MNRNIFIASGAVLLLALGGSLAEARNMGGAGFGGGHIGGGGAHFGGGHVGRNMGASRAFRGGPSTFGRENFNAGRHFNSGRISRGNRGFARRGPVKGWNGGGRHHGRHHHHRGRRVIIGAPYLYDYDYGYYDDGYAGDDCGWLYRRAVRTGSAYWWRRYRACEYEG
ncbi:hypothetical protein [Hyphomicrobium sp.]|uniref:hypothetical protein n=1 Tax=Hyphomicrobium sp. TaxID=82 RepID=UPI002C894F36|nr:hypothetical protein [Hyphomicrobium sp.]HVZ05097.1 hypothetical protein [Hyphomicrobium sp.]